MSDLAAGLALPAAHAEADHHPVEWSPAPYERQFGRFAARLGEGASKLVYRAVDMGSGRLVAWNEVDLTCLSPEERDRVAGEVELLRQVRHPCIMEFIASWDAGEGKRVFITAICETGDLRRFYASHPIKLKIVKRWCRQLISAIAYLHAFTPPVVHRDIKCENILYDTMDGTLRLTDFGLGTRATEDGTCSLTLGTPNFMAPEMWCGEAYDESVDVYAFGMTVLEMVARELPYAECTNPGQILRRVSQGLLPDAFHRIRFPAIAEFISFCITVNPETGRRPTAEQVKAHPFLSEALHPPEDEESVLVAAYVDPVCDDGDGPGEATPGEMLSIRGGSGGGGGVGSAPFPPRLEVHSSRFPTVPDMVGSPQVTPHLFGADPASAHGAAQRLDADAYPPPPLLHHHGDAPAGVDVSAFSARSGAMDGEAGAGIMVRRPSAGPGGGTDVSPPFLSDPGGAPGVMVPTLSLASAETLPPVDDHGVGLRGGDSDGGGADGSMTARSDGMDGSFIPGVMTSGDGRLFGDPQGEGADDRLRASGGDGTEYPPFRSGGLDPPPALDNRLSGDFTFRANSEEPGHMTHIHALQQEFLAGGGTGGGGGGGGGGDDDMGGPGSFMSPPPHAVGAMSRPLGASHGGASEGSHEDGGAVRHGGRDGSAHGSLYGSQSSLNPALFRSGLGPAGGGSDGAVGAMLRHMHGGSMDGSGGLDLGASQGSVGHMHRGVDALDGSALEGRLGSMTHHSGGGSLGGGDDGGEARGSAISDVVRLHEAVQAVDRLPRRGAREGEDAGGHDGFQGDSHLSPSRHAAAAALYGATHHDQDGSDLRHASFDGSTGLMQPPTFDEVPPLALERFAQAQGGMDVGGSGSVDGGHADGGLAAAAASHEYGLHLDRDLPPTGRHAAVPGSMTDGGYYDAASGTEGYGSGVGSATSSFVLEGGFDPRSHGGSMTDGLGYAHGGLEEDGGGGGGGHGDMMLTGGSFGEVSAHHDGMHHPHHHHRQHQHDRADHHDPHAYDAALSHPPQHAGDDFARHGDSMDDVGGMVDRAYHDHDGGDGGGGGGGGGGEYDSRLPGAPEPLHLRGDAGLDGEYVAGDGGNTGMTHGDGMAYHDAPPHGGRFLGGGRGGGGEDGDDGGGGGGEPGDTPWDHGGRGASGGDDGGFAEMQHQYPHHMEQLHGHGHGHGHGHMPSGYGDDGGTTASTPAGTLDMLSPTGTGMFSPTGTFALGGATPAGQDSEGGGSRQGADGMAGMDDGGRSMGQGDGSGGDDDTPVDYGEDRSPAADMMTGREHVHRVVAASAGGSGDGRHLQPALLEPHNQRSSQDAPPRMDQLWGPSAVAHGRQVSGFASEGADAPARRHAEPDANRGPGWGSATGSGALKAADGVAPRCVVMRAYYQDGPDTAQRIMCMMAVLDEFDWTSSAGDEHQARSVCERLRHAPDAGLLVQRLMAIFALLRLCPSCNLQVGPFPEHGWLGLWLCAVPVEGGVPAVGAASSPPPALVPALVAQPVPAPSDAAAPFSPADGHASLLRGGGPVPETPMLMGSLHHHHHHHAAGADGAPAGGGQAVGDPAAPPAFALDDRGGSTSGGSGSGAPPHVHIAPHAMGGYGGGGGGGGDGPWTPQGGDGGGSSTASTAPTTGFLSPSPSHGSLLRPGAQPPSLAASPRQRTGSGGGSLGPKSPSSPPSGRPTALSTSDGGLEGGGARASATSGTLPRGLSGSGELSAGTPPAPTSPGDGSPLTTAHATTSPRRGLGTGSTHGHAAVPPLAPPAAAAAAPPAASTARDRAVSETSSLSASSGALGPAGNHHASAPPAGGALTRRTSGIPALAVGPTSPLQRSASITAPGADAAASTGVESGGGEDLVDRFISQYCTAHDGNFGLSAGSVSDRSGPISKPSSSRSAAPERAGSLVTGPPVGAAVKPALPLVGGALITAAATGLALGSTVGVTPTGTGVAIAAQPITPAPLPTGTWVPGLGGGLTTLVGPAAPPARSAFDFVNTSWAAAPASSQATHAPTGFALPVAHAAGVGVGDVFAADPFAIAPLPATVFAPAPGTPNAALGAAGSVPSHVFDIR